jgi:ABC-2 type transport system ATP-binding protein
MRTVTLQDAPPVLLEACGVTKVFRDFWGRPRVTAVRDLSIRLHQGTVLGLLGPNGAGKSTLIKLILGHLYPTSGSLTVLGRPPRDVEAKRRLGYVPEFAAFYRNLTGEEILDLFGTILDLTPAQRRERTDQLMEMVGLQNARRRQVGEFSHGMGRRLSLAQALLNDPDLLLLDEPTAGMDPVGCYEVKTLIRTLARRGKTVLMSCHLLADVEDVCDQVVVMYGGRIQDSGSVRDLLEQKDELAIHTPVVSDPLLAEVRRILAREVPDGAIRIARPQRSLEAYFLGVVQRAFEQKQETSGAQMSRGVAEYLQQPKPPPPADGRPNTPVATATVPGPKA